MSQEKIEKKILRISFVAGFLFAICEFFMAIYTHSQSVLMDAAYDFSELIIIGVTIFLTPLFHKPISEKRPFGYAQVESIFVIVKGFMMLSVTLGLSANSIEMALSGGNHIDAGQISVFQLILGFASLTIFLVMSYLNRKVSSPTIKGELLGWKMDILYSIGMSTAFFISLLLEKTPLAFLNPYFDQIITIFIVLFMIPENIKMIWHSIKDVFLFSPEQETTEEVKEVCQMVLKQYDFIPVFYDITRTGRRLWVAIYFTIKKDSLSMKELHQASGLLNSKLEEHFENCTGELIVIAKEDTYFGINKD